MIHLPHYPKVERARPLLGTLVAIRFQGAPEAVAHEAVGRAFAEVSKVHDLMSFHEPQSEISRLNRHAHEKAISVHPYTYEVLRLSLEFAKDSGGVFDPTVAAQLVQWGRLPAPKDAPDPDPGASWQDIELTEGESVRFHRPLWVDFGGIAKGFAVDRAMDTFDYYPEAQRCVNAGGDLSIKGPAAEKVQMNVQSAGPEIPVLEIENGSVASSSGEGAVDAGETAASSHVDGTRRCGVGARSFVSVIAEQCATADALTKVVLAQGSASDELLRRHSAAAYLHDDRDGWRALGVGS